MRYAKPTRFTFNWFWMRQNCFVYVCINKILTAAPHTHRHTVKCQHWNVRGSEKIFVAILAPPIQNLTSYLNYDRVLWWEGSVKSWPFLRLGPDLRFSSFQTSLQPAPMWAGWCVLLSSENWVQALSWRFSWAQRTNLNQALRQFNNNCFIQSLVPGFIHLFFPTILIVSY